jgi:hypothetical protein
MTDKDMVIAALFYAAELATLIAALHIGLWSFTDANLLSNMPAALQMLLGAGAMVGGVRGLWNETMKWW